MGSLYQFLNRFFHLFLLFAHFGFILRSSWFITRQCALKRFEAGLSILYNDGSNACSDCAISNENCVVSGKQNDSGVWIQLSYLLRSIQSVHCRHGEIEHDSVGVQFMDQCNGLFAVGSFTTDFQVGALF